MNQQSIEKLLQDQAGFLISKVNDLEEIIIELLKFQSKELFGNSQIRNLLNTTAHAHPQEVILFIQYKIGRDGSTLGRGESWNKHVRGKIFGQHIIDKLNEIQQQVLTMTKDPQLLNSLTSAMFQRFFLYWAWKYRYLSTMVQAHNNTNRRGTRR